MSSLLFKHREFETPPAIARATGCAADTVRPSLSQVIDEYVEHSKTKRSRKTGKKLARYAKTKGWNRSKAITEAIRKLLGKSAKSGK